MAIDRDPYRVLGVARTATEAEIRDAYRRLARRLHPDVAGHSEPAGSPTGSPTGPANGPTMAEVNEAWSLLSDPARRRALDEVRSQPERGNHVGVDHETVAVGPLPRARIPWKLMLGIVVIGSAAVLTAHANTDAPAPGTPDQLIQSGSCVDIDDTSAALEVSCDGPHEGVVRQLIAFDRACPQDTSSHRDRQGMGIACVDLVEVQPGQGSG